MRPPERRRSTFAMRIVVTTLACAIVHPLALASQATATAAAPAPAPSALRLGDVFPHLGGQALSGHTINVPVPGAVKPTVVIMSFSREGGRDAQRWGERLSADPWNGEVDLVVVPELEAVPRLLRGSVTRMIKRGVPANLRDRVLTLDRDAAAWKQRLAVTSTARSYAVLVDSSGRVRWMSTRPFDDDGLAELRRALGR